MTRKASYIFDGNPTSVLGRLLHSPIRCHCFSSVLCLVIAAGIGWVWVNSEEFAFDDRHSSEEIERVSQLLTCRDAWRSSRLMHEQVYNEQQSQIGTIQAWLPESVDWDESESVIRAAASQHGVTVVDIEENGTSVGARVAFTSANCQLNGDLIGLCKMMKQLSNMEQPIWCVSLRLRPFQRESTLQDDADSVDDDPSQDPQHSVTATLTLRIPFAGKNSAAKKMFLMGDQSAS